MATEKQRSAAKQNIKKAQSAAKDKRTLAHLSDADKTAMGKKGAAARKKS
jgi:hypothetical protein